MMVLPSCPTPASMDESLVHGAALSALSVLKWSALNQQVSEKNDLVAEEVPIALIYNGITHAVMLATPEYLEDFAYGFSLAEQIIDSPSDIYGVELNSMPQGIEVNIELSSAHFQRLKERRRSLTGRTGCGLCGSESLAQALRLPQQRLQDNSLFTHAMLKDVLVNMAEFQPMQEQTGATHACALVDVSGQILLAREDVGRHNALDKLIGAMRNTKMLEDSSAASSRFVLTTSRASYEMVQKTIIAGIPMLVAMSAPTGLAVRIAKQAGLTLVGFTRAQQHVVYSHPERLV